MFLPHPLPWETDFYGSHQPRSFASWLPFGFDQLGAAAQDRQGGEIIKRYVFLSPSMLGHGLAMALGLVKASAAVMLSSCWVPWFSPFFPLRSKVVTAPTLAHCRMPQNPLLAFFKCIHVFAHSLFRERSSITLLKGAICFLVTPLRTERETRVREKHVPGHRGGDEPGAFQAWRISSR